MKRGTMNNIQTGATVALGFAAANVLNKTGFIAANPMLQVVAPIGAAILTKSMLGSKGSTLALGMIAAGVINGVRAYAPGVASTVGLAGVPYRSGYLPGVSGRELPQSIVMG